MRAAALLAFACLVISTQVMGPMAPAQLSQYARRPFVTDSLPPGAADANALRLAVPRIDKASS
jgi:hypothetical protein